MPSTITTYYTFVAGTKARSSQVNTNFSNYRGDVIPINEDSASASDLTHNLGAATHRWLRTYTDNVQFHSATTGAECILRGNTSATAGGFLFQINSVTVSRISPVGFDATYIEDATLHYSAFLVGSEPTLRSTLFNNNGSWTCPSYVTNAILLGWGGGGGGGGGGGNPAGGGGGGGGGSLPVLLQVTGLSGTYGISIGAGGGGGNGGSAGNPGTAGSGGGDSKFGILATFQGASGGLGGETGTGVGGLGGNTSATTRHWFVGGGNGGLLPAAGDNSNYAVGGAAGGDSGGVSGGGGGGGAGYGPGGAGGNSGNSGGTLQAGSPGPISGSGAGGGGSGGAFNAGGALSGGNGRAGSIIVSWVGST